MLLVRLCTWLIFSSFPLLADEVASKPTPSVQTSFQDTRRQNEHPTISLTPIGFPQNVDITLAVKRPIVKGKDQDFGKLLLFRIDNQGQILTESKKVVEALSLNGSGYIPGERIDLRFQSTDQTFKYEMTLVPNPIKAKNTAKGMSLQAEVLSLDPTTYKLLLEGIPNEMEISLRYTGAGAPVDRTFLFDSSLPIIITPDVKEQTGGFALVTLYAKNRGTIKVRLPWGNRQKEYLKGRLIYKG